MVPTRGSFLKNARTIGKKSPKRLKKPKSSMIMPMIAHPMRTRNIPLRKGMLPFSFLLWKKKFRVFLKPITSVTPDRNKRFPIARRPRSKNNNTPKIVKKIPKLVRIIPISEERGGDVAV